MTIARGYSQRIRHLSSLESMIYFSTSQKGYVCHRTLKGLLEIAAEAEMEKKEKKKKVRWFSFLMRPACFLKDFPSMVTLFEITFSLH